MECPDTGQIPISSNPLPCSGVTARQLSLDHQRDSMSLTLDELDSHLYGCADKIRNAVDKTDYKDFILPLVFYKTISDTYQDEVEKWTEELGSEELARDPDLHDIVVPEEYTWDHLRGLNTQETNYDEFINEALSAIGDANPGKLEGVFRADYVSEDALDNGRLSKLVEHLSTHNLSAKRVPPDMLGEAYMDLVRDFAEEEGKEAGSSSRRPRSSGSWCGSSPPSRMAIASTTPQWALAGC